MNAAQANQARVGSKCLYGIELLAVSFVMGVTGLVVVEVSRRFGPLSGMFYAIPALIVSVSLVVVFYWWLGRRDKMQLQRLREKYRGIYRVLALPTDEKSIIKAGGAEIKIGDFGWEAGPVKKDGLIHLQGLTPEWTIVWHAGFRPEQIERVAEKPSSQYDYWVPYWAKPRSLPPCPYTVKERATLTLGRPHHSNIHERPTPYTPKHSS